MARYILNQGCGSGFYLAHQDPNALDEMRNKIYHCKFGIMRSVRVLAEGRRLSWKIPRGGFMGDQGVMDPDIMLHLGERKIQNIVQKTSYSVDLNAERGV